MNLGRISFCQDYILTPDALNLVDARKRASRLGHRDRRPSTSTSLTSTLALTSGIQLVVVPGKTRLDSTYRIPVPSDQRLYRDRGTEVRRSAHLTY